MGRNKPNYNVVATDYKNYAVVYTCEYFGPELKFGKFFFVAEMTIFFFLNITYFYQHFKYSELIKISVSTFPEFSWILARRPQIPNSFLTDLKHWLQLVNINAKRYMPTVQTNCPNRAVS